jgi:hypothetical protein
MADHDPMHGGTTPPRVPLLETLTKVACDQSIDVETRLEAVKSIAERLSSVNYCFRATEEIRQIIADTDGQVRLAAIRALRR